MWAGKKINLFRRRVCVEDRNISTSFGISPKVILFLSINSKLRNSTTYSSLCTTPISENIIYKTSKKGSKGDGVRNSFFYKKISAGII